MANKYANGSELEPSEFGGGYETNEILKSLGFTISSIVDEEWNSTKKDSEKAEIFLKIEPYLTFLNVHQLERQGADIQSKVEQLEQLNQSIRDRDKMKDDAIAHLSDQLIALTTRLDSIERRQQ